MLFIINVKQALHYLKRRTIAISFSQAFETMLLNSRTAHTSLTHDLEALAYQGLKLLDDLEDVKEIIQVTRLRKLIPHANRHAQISSEYFTSWQITLSEDLLDEIDLLILMHGEDLKDLGLNNVSQGSIIVLLCTAALIDI